MIVKIILIYSLVRPGSFPLPGVPVRVPDPDERDGSPAVASPHLHKLGDGVGVPPLQPQSHCVLLVSRVLKQETGLILRGL